ncbi:MAG: type 4a pilus biogenesis protein PilO, partial [Nitrospirae bacterium]|nr:type 4a pilus biogenesis protein PilO [Nitrospirota bacterium]
MKLKLNLNLNLGSKIENLPPLKKNLLLAAPPVIIVILFVYMVIMPFLEEKKVLIEEINKQNAEIETLKKSSFRLPMLKAENKRLADKLVELQLQLPEEKEVSGLLKQVSELAVKSGLQVILWRPKGKNIHPSNEVYEIPVDVEMRGVYHMFGQFFSNVTALSRIVNISNISMRVGDQKFQKGAAGLNVSFNAMTYSLIPEKEKKELQKKEEKKK